MNAAYLTKLAVGHANIVVKTDAPNSEPITGRQQRLLFDIYVHHHPGNDAKVVKPRRGEIIAMPLLIENQLAVGLTARADNDALHLTVSPQDFDVLVEHMLLTQRIIRSEEEGLIPSDQPAPPGERG